MAVGAGTSGAAYDKGGDEKGVEDSEMHDVWVSALGRKVFFAQANFEEMNHCSPALLRYRQKDFSTYGLQLVVLLSIKVCTLCAPWHEANSRSCTKQHHDSPLKHEVH